MVKFIQGNFKVLQLVSEIEYHVTGRSLLVVAVVIFKDCHLYLSEYCRCGDGVIIYSIGITIVEFIQGVNY